MLLVVMLCLAHKLSDRLLDGLLALAFSRSYMPARDSATGQAASAALQQVFLRHAVAERVLVRYQTVCHLGA